jgi:hypothetical protein
VIVHRRQVGHPWIGLIAALAESAACSGEVMFATAPRRLHRSSTGRVRRVLLGGLIGGSLAALTTWFAGAAACSRRPHSV